MDIRNRQILSEIRPCQGYLCCQILAASRYAFQAEQDRQLGPDFKEKTIERKRGAAEAERAETGSADGAESTRGTRQATDEGRARLRHRQLCKLCDDV